MKKKTINIPLASLKYFKIKEQPLIMMSIEVLKKIFHNTPMLNHPKL